MEEQDIYTLFDLMLEQIRDLYDGEQQQLPFLDKAAQYSTSFDLRELIYKHHRETGKQLHRLDGVFEMLGEKSSGETCDGIKGLVREALKLAARCKNDEVRDAGLITTIQHINHYEMAGYGTAIAYAKAMGRHNIAQALLEILKEEKEADSELSDLAESSINLNAKQSAEQGRAHKS